MLRILSIEPGTPASRARLKRDDLVVSCNGSECDDWLDFAYSATDCRIDLVYKRGPRVRNMTLSRSPGSDWGFCFQGQSPRSCCKRCVFCFVDQLPPGVRASLRKKDDDIRHSFFYGTYVTLRREDVRLAIEKNLSPIHVSVHSTNPLVRGRLLGTPSGEPVIPFLEELSNAGISVEAQIVVVPGWNDEDELGRTLRDLFRIPSVLSVGVVPVGLTSFRKGLEPLRRPTASESKMILEMCSFWRARALQVRDTPWVYPSDEFFLLAHTRIPSPDYYEDCTLRENGIGLLAELTSLECRSFTGEGLICTGTLAAPFISKVMDGSAFGVLSVKNSFLGPGIGVAGLLPGGDIVKSVEKAGAHTGPVILPRIMFNSDMHTIDDFTPAVLEQRLQREIRIVEGLEELS